jgi:hypothetical protein
MTTVITNERTAQASAHDDGLWVPLAGLEAATGWHLEPEGACLGERCVPLPHGRESEFVRGGEFNILALAEHLGQPAVHSTDHDAWVIGESAEWRGQALRSLQAPDFTLPDLEGRPHSLSDYRGRKIFLFSWASW